MRDWQQHWQTFPLSAGPDPLRQVGKTVAGRPIAPAQFEALVDDVLAGLRLDGSERVLDLCCGNGLLTRRIAGRCREVVAVDFSKPLLDVARRNHNPPNVTYLAASVLDPGGPAALRNAGTFDRVNLYEGLQHFRRRDLPAVLRLIAAVTGPGRRALIGSVPDQSRRWAFYNTLRRRVDFLVRICQGREAIGTWWTKDFIRRACEACGFRCEFRAQNPQLHTAHYRFDAWVW